ncbi:unnamed protein product [Trichobilharzia regenti]|nr:unnamed protein product [Trichobilharzia regenti]
MNVLRFSEFLHIDAYQCLELVTVVGTILAFFSSFFIAYRTADILLLEAGFLAVLLSSFGAIGMWLLRWLLFRLMFASGVVKLTSDCPAWWGLKCIPTPVAWYMHSLPGWFHSICVAAAFIIEIPMTFLFFVPLRLVRLVSFYSQVSLHIISVNTQDKAQTSMIFSRFPLTMVVSMLQRRTKRTAAQGLRLLISRHYVYTELFVSLLRCGQLM